MSSERQSAADTDAMDRRRFIKLGAAGGSTIALSGILSACGGGSAKSSATGAPVSGVDTAKPPARASGVLRVANDSAPLSLDPAVDVGPGLFLARNLYGGLSAYGPNGEVIPWLAQSVSSNEDATEWTFKLREGVKFHDGSELDSVAVKKSYEHYIASKSLWTTPIPAGSEFDASDPGVFKIKSKTTAPDVGRTAPIIQIFSSKLLAKGIGAPAKTPVGAGPYKFRSYTQNQSVILDANEDFWGDGPYFERLEFRIINEPTARVAALRSGGLDLVYKVGPEQLPQLRNDSKFRIVSGELWTGTSLVLITDDGTLSNPDVRRAIAHAIDRQALIKKIALDEASPLNSFFPHGVYGAVQPKTTYDYNPDEAKTLLAQAGVKPGQISIRIASNAAFSPRNVALVQAIAQMISDVGIKATADVVDLGGFQTAIVGRKKAPKWWGYAANAGWLNGGPIFVATGYLSQTSGWNPPDYQALAKKAMATADGPERESLLSQIQEKIAADAPIVPLYQPKISSVMKADIHGFTNPRDAYLNYYGNTFRAAAS
ncbi:MAG: peptide/nickel transport system substrate-binding protein [Solirubrobacteraceae bacterium]